jgi:preprotein translocase subunit SecG
MVAVSKSFKISKVAGSNPARNSTFFLAMLFFLILIFFFLKISRAGDIEKRTSKKEKLE